jgi:hypothetical protein
MPKLDKYHNTVKRALAKDDWQISYDPLLLKYKGLHLYVDLAAEKFFDDKRVAIEIKVFESDSLVNDFEKAIGQYNLYRFVLEKVGFQYELYLAITEKVYEKFNDKPAILEYINEKKIHLLIFNAEMEEILQWIK